MIVSFMLYSKWTINHKYNNIGTRRLRILFTRVYWKYNCLGITYNLMFQTNYLEKFLVQ